MTGLIFVSTGCKGIVYNIETDIENLVSVFFFF